MQQLKTTLLLLLAVLVLTACGGDNNRNSPAPVTEPATGSGDEPAPEPEPRPQATITVTPSLGRITGADVLVTQADGTPIAGATGSLTEDGTVSITHDGTYTGPILVTVTGNDGATYFDESAGTNLPMGADVSIRAFAPSPLEDVGVTILTELAAQIVDKLEGAISAADVEAINNSVRASLAPDIPDLLTPPTIVSEDNISTQSLANDAGGVYALRLAALATLAAGEAAPALAILNQLASDLADGVIDGNGADGALASLSYTASDFANLFSNALELAASSLADTDLMAVARDLAVAIDDNLLQAVLDAGVVLPASVTVLIDASDIPVDVGGSTGGDITGDFDLTVSGEVITLGIGTEFSAIITNIVAPTPSDTAEVQKVIEESIAGLSNIQNLIVTIVNNTSDRITFDVSFDANQSGVTVSFKLRYDYVPAGTSPTDSGSDSSGDSSTGGDSSLASDAEIAALGQVCFFGGGPEAVQLPAFLTAEARTLSYFAASAGSPYENGQTATFVFSSSGKLFIDDVEVAGSPVICNGNDREAIWKDLANNLIYSVSDLQGSFNEVNVNSGDGGSFLGQFSQN